MHKLAVAASRSALVLQELEVNENGPTYVRLKGRKSGLVAWLLALIGIDPTTTLEITGDRIDYVEGSLSGKMKHTIPINAVCNLGTGYFKPVALLVGAIVCVVLSIVITLMGGSSFIVLMLFVAAVTDAICYYLGNTLVVFMLPGSGTGPVIGFKRSVIEGVVIDEKTAYNIVDIVTDLVVRNRKVSKD